MLQLIENEYNDCLRAGEEVAEIQLSQIAMDHLKAELNNRKERPEWLPLLRVTEDFQEHRLLTRNFQKSYLSGV